MKIPKLRIFRIIVQVIFLLILPYIFTLTFDGLRSIYVALISGDYNFYNQLPKIISVIAILPLTILFGRFFCGWMCAFGSIGEMVYLFSSKVFKVKFRISSKADFYLKFVKYIILMICVVFVWSLGYKNLSVFSPWDAYGQLPNLYLAYKGFFVGIVIFALVMVASLFVERFFCRYLCPLGAFFVLVSRLRIFKIKKPTEKCGKCRVCTYNCPMGIPLNEYEMIRSGECIECMNCTSLCPRKNTSLSLVGRDLNPLIASSVIVASITAIHYGTEYSLKLSDNNNYEMVILNEQNLNNQQNKKYIDGTYTGVANGYRPGLNVSVTIKDDKIVKITIGANNEESGYKEEPFSIIPKRIIDKQSTNVSVVSGATYSSKGIMNAVNNALSKALIIKNTNPVSDSAPKNTPSPTAPGTSSNTPTISINPTPNNTQNNKPSPSKSNTSTNAPTNSVIKFNDGTYSGTGYGYVGKITVSVTIINQKITSIVFGTFNESKPKSAKKDIPNKIIAAQSTNVSVVSGATYTSKGIKDAVSDALRKATVANY